MNPPPTSMFARIPGASYFFKMMSTLVSAFSGVGDKVSRLFYNNSYNIAEQRTYLTDGHTRNKRLRLAPPEHTEVRWATDAEFRHVAGNAKQLSTLLDSIRELGGKVCPHEGDISAANALRESLNVKLQPLEHCLTDNSTELNNVRAGGFPDLTIMWFRGLCRISAFLENMYDSSNVVDLRKRYHDHVPNSFKHDLGPLFNQHRDVTKGIISNPYFVQIFIDTCAILGYELREGSLPVPLVERVIADICALENELPPMSFVSSLAYHQRLEAKFPPPAWATKDDLASYNTSQNEDIPGVFPQAPFRGQQTPSDSEQDLRGDAFDREDSRMPSQTDSQQRHIHATSEVDNESPGFLSRSGRGLLPNFRGNTSRTDLLRQRVSAGRIARAGRGKSAMVRARFEAIGLKDHRSRKDKEARTAIESQYNRGNEPKSPADHRSVAALPSIYKAPPRPPRRVQFSENTLSPEHRGSPIHRRAAFAVRSILRARSAYSTSPLPRRHRSVRFTDYTLSPQPRSRTGVEIPRLDDASSATSSESVFQETLSQGERSPSPLDYMHTSRQNGYIGEERSLQRHVPKSLGRGPLEELDAEEVRQRFEALLSEPSPVGLKQSDDSRAAIDLKKKEEAAKAAAAKKKAEEKARKEAEEKAQRELEERLAKSGGLRLPNKRFIAPLPATWEDRAHGTLSAGGTVSLATTDEGVDLRRHDFAKVVPETEWLNDEIVNGSLIWLDRAINAAAGIKKADFKVKTRKCLVLSSFFYTKLKDQGVTGTARLLKRNGVTKDNLLDVDTILIPICESMHWTLLVVRPRSRTVAHMDSLNPRGSDKNTSLALAWMKDVLQEKFVGSEWKVVRHEAPRQTNGWDCGVHTITNAMCVALGLSPIDSYTAADMPLQRLRIAATLLNGGFTGDFDLQVF